MSRKSNIDEKLEYIEHQRQKLLDEMFSAKSEKRDPKFIVHSSSEILSGARECYDYCANDITEQHILPNTKNKKILKDKRDGKLRAYFPFHEPQVKRNGALFHELKAINNPLYLYLIDMVESISANRKIPNTLFEYKKLMSLKDMVNEKKHDRLIGVESNSEEEIMVKNDDFKMIIPIKQQKGWNRLKVQEGSDVSRVSEYRFEYNNEEVGDFCLFSVKATEIILNDIYKFI